MFLNCVTSFIEHPLNNFEDDYFSVPETMSNISWTDDSLAQMILDFHKNDIIQSHCHYFNWF